jgi:hypothetical protein
MSKRKLPPSVAKYIRKEKGRIRREVVDAEEQGRQIEEILNQYKDYLIKK